MNEKLHSVIVFIENFLIDFLNIFGINQEDYYLCKSQLILYIQKLYHLLLDICITFICISLIESSPDSCVKCYTMFLPFLLIKIDVF
ncbi:hypothetical protein ACO1KW_13860, partial [Staphylococcus aureus]